MKNSDTFEVLLTLYGVEVVKVMTKILIFFYIPIAKLPYLNNTI